MWIAIKNWLIKIAVKGLVKAKKFKFLEDLLKEIVNEVIQKTNIKDEKKLEKQG